MKTIKQVLTILLFLAITCSSSYAQNVEARLTGSPPNFSIELRATAPFLDNAGVAPSASPNIFVVRVRDSQGGTVNVSGNDPLNMGGDVDRIFSGDDAYFVFTARVSEFDLSTLSNTSFSSYLNFSYSGPGTDISISGISQMNLVDTDVLVILSSLIVLPVELSYFTAQAKSDNTSLLKWETSSEINNDYFSVQHSVNGLDFDEIGVVDGNGTTDEVKNYDFVHKNPVRGTNYYRLTQVDFDGKSENSPIRSVEFDGIINTNFKVFPNPSHNYLMIVPPDTTQDIWNVDVYDSAGKRIESFIIRDNFYHLNTTELPNGMYHLQVNSGTQSNQLRFVKH